MIDYDDLLRLANITGPEPWQKKRLARLQKAALHFAKTINEECPTGDNQDCAIGKLLEALNMANLTVALMEKPFEEE